MRNIFIILMIVSYSSAFCQLYPKIEKLKEYKAANGIVYHVDDTVKLGKGSGVNDQFLYLQNTGTMSVLFYDKNKSGDQLNAARFLANTNVVIKKIHSYSSNGGNTVSFMVKGGSGTHYELAINNAISNCEVLPCVSKTSLATEDNLDKIKRLKALFDSGAITQTEYDEQKRKLLEGK